MNTVLYFALLSDPGATVAVTDAACAARKNASPAIPDDFAGQAHTSSTATLRRKTFCIRYFGAEWCKPCREVQAGTFVELKKSWIIRSHGDGGSAHIWVVDVDREPAFTRRMLGDNPIVPAWILFANGKECERLTGKQSAAQITQWVRRHLEVQP